MKKIEKDETEKKINSLLNTFAFPEIKESDKKETIQLLKAYMSIQQERTFELMKNLVWQAFIEIISLYKMQLMILLLLMFMAYTVLPETMNGWCIFIITAPSPIFLVGWHLMNNYTEEMIELEITYKYSFQQMLFSKIVAISTLSIAIYSGVLLYMILINNAFLSTTLLHIAVSGLTPILLFCLTLLALSIKYRNLMSWTVILLVWIFFFLLSIYTPIGTILFSINTSVYVVINIILFVLFVHQLKHVWKMERIKNASY